MEVLGKTLFNHQIEGADYMFTYAQGVANFSEQGTGKTCMSIVTLNIMSPARILIVCPNFLKFNWKKEFKIWSEINYHIMVLDGSKSNKLKALETQTGEFDVVVVNYESLTSIESELIKFNPQLIIADESQNIKNHKAKKTKAIKKIADKSKACQFRWILTGTPTPNNPLDIWSQYDFIRPKHLGPNFYAFRAVYADVYTGAGFPMIKGFRNQERLKSLVSEYSYRVIKDECLDLPDKTYETIEVELKPKTMKVYKNMAEHMVAEVGGSEVSANIILVKLLRLQQICSGFIKDDLDNEIEVGDEKLKALEELLDSINGDSLFGSSDKVVIWCKFKREIRMIQQMVKKMGRSVHVLSGEVSNEDRNKAVEEFQASDKNDVLIANIKVGSTGLTLTSARYAIYFSRPFSLGDSLQSEDRIHRIGQKRKVVYYDLVCKGTIDQYIVQLLRKKKALSDRLTGDDVKRIAMGIF